MVESFHAKLTAAVARTNSLLCVGLDPDPFQFASHFARSNQERRGRLEDQPGVDGEALTDWGRRIIEATDGLVCCYKPNIAFYEQFGAVGIEALRQTIAATPVDVPVLLDAKRGDIGSTATAYARAAFETLRADAVTVNPYLGRDAIAPFLAYPGKTVFILAYTSNPSATTIQEFGEVGAIPLRSTSDPGSPVPSGLFPIQRTGEALWPPASQLPQAGAEPQPQRGERLFEHVVREALGWGSAEQIAFVVGATQPQALARVRELLAGRPCWLLAPGIGAQGGDMVAALTAGLDNSGSGLLIPVSRHVIYADDVRAAALALRDAINAERRAWRAEQVAGSREQGAGSKEQGATAEPPVALSSGHLVAPSPSRPSSELETIPEGPASQVHLLTPLILSLYDVGCVQFGDFTLASGVRSPIYLDLRRMASDPALLRQAAAAYTGLLEPLSYDRLAAVPYAALTIGTAVALATNRPLIYPRKEVKPHGTGQAIEGVFKPGERVVVVEDLVTSAGSVLKAIETLEASGLFVYDVVVLIDRGQGGAANLAAAGHHLHAALTMAEIVSVLLEAGRISSEEAATVKEYLATA